MPKPSKWDFVFLVVKWHPVIYEFIIIYCRRNSVSNRSNNIKIELSDMENSSKYLILAD